MSGANWEKTRDGSPTAEDRQEFSIAMERSSPKYEKSPSEVMYSRSESDKQEAQYDFDSEEFRNIPDLVRAVVSFEDDPSSSVITFRSILLAVIFCIIGSIVSQIS